MSPGGTIVLNTTSAPLRHDAVHGRVVLHVVERVVLLAHDRAPEAGDHLADLRVQHVRPDVVGRREVEGRGTGVLHEPREERLDLLGGDRSRAEDQRVALLALVLLGVDVQLSSALHHGALDRLPRRAVDATEHDVDVVLVDHPGGRGRGGLVVGGAVLDDQPDRSAEQTAGTR